MDVPFFPNSDKNHCLQACVKMILKHYYPEKDFSFEQIDKLFGYRGKVFWSSPIQAAVVLDGLGLEAKSFAREDFETYLKDGSEYIKKKYSDWENILKNMDMELELSFIKKALNKGLVENMELKFEGMESFFRKGAIVSPAINVNVLKNKEGYAGHAVLITDIGDDFVELHDPGLPPIPNRKVDKEKFIRAWYDFDTGRYTLIVFGKR
ncbi:MAG: hypothetical protein JSV92_00195 [archaeon]|nr:MAG: hypothetical protein JSV92_00195 [archaeon]